MYVGVEINMLSVTKKQKHKSMRQKFLLIDVNQSGWDPESIALCPLGDITHGQWW